MDPEQIYQEVLQEEQSKGSAAPVAEGRAKAARQRAVEGSPHPKEPKWWPGSQPRWEGGDGAAAAPAEEAVAEEEPAEAPAAPAEETSAEEAPAEETSAAEAPAEEAPAAEAPAPAEPAAEQPSAEPAPAPAAVAAATAPPTGVTHGTTTGTRLRPEDAVSTQVQFDGQQAVYERRKLIDELVSSGVPTVTAQDALRPRAPFLAVLYILIPIIAAIILVSQNEEGGSGEAPPPAPDGGGGLSVTADNIAFDTDTITVTAGEEATIDFENADSVEHNIAVYPDQAAGVAKSDAIFTGDIIQGGQSITYDVPAVDAGEYYFQCDVHPNMNGAYVAE